MDRVGTVAERAGENVQQSQKMEAIGRLAGSIAHNYNNLLTAILGYTELILSDLKPDDPLRPELEEVHKAGQRAEAFTRQLLAFSRRQVIQPKILDLNSVVAHVEQSLRSLITQEIFLTCIAGSELGLVKADPRQLEQLLTNLVLNARDAMPQGGKLTIKTRNVQLDDAYVHEHIGSRKGPHVLLQVQDTGVGMNPDVKFRVFEPFFTTKAPGKSTGLGMATVYGIVKQSGGYIWCDSAPGAGTIFQIYLPCVEGVAQSVRPQARGEATSMRGCETVLVVEDEPTVRSLACTLLRRSGYTVLEAEDGSIALKICMEYSRDIDLVLTDIVMPRMSGRDLTSRLIEVRPEIRVLYMSGHTDDSVRSLSGADLGDALLQKPFTCEALLLKVREILGTVPEGS